MRRVVVAGVLAGLAGLCLACGGVGGGGPASSAAAGRGAAGGWYGAGETYRLARADGEREVALGKTRDAILLAIDLADRGESVALGGLAYRGEVFVARVGTRVRVTTADAAVPEVVVLDGAHAGRRGYTVATWLAND